MSEERRIATQINMTGIAGFESITDRSILGSQFPELRIHHATRRQGELGVPGQYKLNAQPLPMLAPGAKIPPTKVIFLKGQQMRLLSEGPTRDKMRAVCASSDGREPVATLLHPRGRNCIECDYAQWKDGPNDKRIPPPCRPGLAFFGILPGDPENDAAEDQPFWFVCKGGGAFRRAKEFIQAIRGARNARGIWQVVVNLTTSEESNNGVYWYDPVFSITEERLPYERFAEMARLAGTEAVYVPFVREAAPLEADEVIDVTGQTTGRTGEAAPWESTDL
jgi:hypothetical protein